MEESDKIDRESRAAEKRASRREDAERLKKGESPEVLQRENSIFPDGFFDNARIRNRKIGAGDEEILRNFPTLQPADLVNAWRYVERHPAEIDREILANEAA